MAKKKVTTYCPECDAKITLKMPRVGYKIVCNQCDARLEVVQTSPLELDWDYEGPAVKGRRQFGDVDDSEFGYGD